MRARARQLEWVWALLAGLALRTAFVLHHPRFLGDPEVYGDIATNVLRHHIYGLTEDHVRSTLIRLPGYPLFLALCFAAFGQGRFMPVLWMQVATDLGTCVAIGCVAARIFGPRAGTAAVWLSALCPFTANYTATPLTETLSIACVAWALWALAVWVDAVRRGRRTSGWALSIGLFCALATLLRPDGVLLAAAVLPAMVWGDWHAERRRLREELVGQCGAGQHATVSSAARAVQGAAVAGGVLCAALGLWTVRNWRVFHVLQPLAPKYANDPGEDAPLGFARWYRTWAIGYGDSVRVYWTYDGSLLSMSDLPPRAFDSPAQRQETAALIARYNDLSSATPEIDAAFARLAAERVRAHPVRFSVMLPAAKLADMWLRPRTELMKMPLAWWNVRVRPRAALFSWAYGLLNAALLAAAAAGLWKWRRRGWMGAGLIAATMVSFVLLRSAMLMTIDNSEPRYVLECYPVVLVLAAAATGGFERLGSFELRRVDGAEAEAGDGRGA